MKKTKTTKPSTKTATISGGKLNKGKTGGRSVSPFLQTNQFNPNSNDFNEYNRMMSAMDDQQNTTASQSKRYGAPLLSSRAQVKQGQLVFQDQFI